MVFLIARFWAPKWRNFHFWSPKFDDPQNESLFKSSWWIFMSQNVNIIVYIWSPNLVMCAIVKIDGCTRLPMGAWDQPKSSSEGLKGLLARQMTIPPLSGRSQPRKSGWLIVEMSVNGHAHNLHIMKAHFDLCLTIICMKLNQMFWCHRWDC